MGARSAPKGRSASAAGPHVSPQPESFLSLNLHKLSQQIPQKVLTSSQREEDPAQRRKHAGMPAGHLQHWLRAGLYNRPLFVSAEGMTLWAVHRGGTSYAQLHGVAVYGAGDAVAAGYFSSSRDRPLKAVSQFCGK